MVTFSQSSYQLKWGGAVEVIDLRATLNLPFFNDEEVVALVPLVEHELTSAHIHDLQAVDQFKFGVFLKALEQLNFVEVF